MKLKTMLLTVGEVTRVLKADGRSGWLPLFGALLALSFLLMMIEAVAPLAPFVYSLF